MALNANSNPNYIVQGGTSNQFPLRIKTGKVVYNCALLCFDSPTGACMPYDGVRASRIMVGFHFGDTVTGDTAAKDPKTANVHPGAFCVQNLPVAALVGDDTDLGQTVWASDDGTFTLTDPTPLGVKVGRVIGKWDSTHAQVEMIALFGVSAA